MNKRECKKLLNSLKYKPEFEFKFHFIDDYVAITGRRSTRDTGDIDNDVLLEHTREFLYKGATEMDLMLAIRDWIHDAERHEADEWLRFNGKNVTNPHKCKVDIF